MALLPTRVGYLGGAASGAQERMQTFGDWLHKKCQGDENIDDQLYLLARQLSWHVLTYKGYEINGNTFYTVGQDKRSTN